MYKIIRNWLGLEDMKERLFALEEASRANLLTDRELLSATLSATAKQLIEVKRQRDILQAKLTQVLSELKESDANVEKLMAVLEKRGEQGESAKLTGLRSALDIALRHNEKLDHTIVEALTKLAQRDAGIEQGVVMLKNTALFAGNTEDDIREWLSGRQEALNERIAL